MPLLKFPAALCVAFKCQRPAGLRSPSRNRIRRSFFTPTDGNGRPIDGNGDFGASPFFLAAPSQAMRLDLGRQPKAALGSMSINLSIKTTIPKLDAFRKKNGISNKNGTMTLLRIG
jgi:hypothetical protein